MENNITKDSQSKNKLVLFYEKNKIILFSFVFLVIIIVASLIIFDKYKKNENKIISEKYIQAGLLIAAKEDDKAYKIYREIIEDKNKFYSILSLNTVLEKNLEPNKEIILSYFRILEKMSISKDQKDVLILKKSLYFMDQSNKVEGEKLLKSLINSNSTLKSIAEEILNK